MKRTRTLIIGVLLGFFLGIILVSVVSRLQLPPKISKAVDDKNSQLQINAPAPNFELQNLNGDLVNLRNFHGRILLVNFWATWCAPCRLEMPAFQSRIDVHPDDLVVVTVNSQDTLDDIQNFMNELGLTFYALIDPDGDVHKRYMVQGFPTTYLVDRDGILRIQHIGLITDGQLDTYLSELGLSE